MKWQADWAQLRQKTCLSGHYDFGFWPLLEQGLKTKVEPVFITMLRDPLERALSLYHWYGHEEQRYQAEVSKMTFEQFARDTRPDWTFLDNDAVRRIAGVRRGAKGGCIDAVDLERAISNLSYFPMVGLTERFDESVGRWAKLLGWESAEYDTERVQGDRLRAHQLDKGTIEAVYHRQRYDNILYHYVKARYWEGQV